MFSKQIVFALIFCGALAIGAQAQHDRHGGNHQPRQQSHGQSHNSGQDRSGGGHGAPRRDNQGGRRGSFGGNNHPGHPSFGGNNHQGHSSFGRNNHQGHPNFGGNNHQGHPNFGGNARQYGSHFGQTSNHGSFGSHGVRQNHSFGGHSSSQFGRRSNGAQSSQRFNRSNSQFRRGSGTFQGGHFQNQHGRMISRAPVRAGVNAPPRTAWRNPGGRVSTRNYPRPHYGNTYVTNNIQLINNNYRYDSEHYRPHVVGFYGREGGPWGDHWRYGCWERPGFHISFGFSFYVFTPFYTDCVASPWYDYPCVPAYIPEDRVIVEPGYACDWNEGVVYEIYRGPDRALNHACSDLREAFYHQDPAAVEGLLGGGRVAVFSEGKYEYSLEAGDFEQMLSDNVRATQTDSFQITRVRHRGGRAIIDATHSFQSPDGNRDTVYQRYRLERDGGRYVITDFMTSHTPFAGGSYF